MILISISSPNQAPIFKGCKNLCSKYDAYLEGIRRLGEPFVYEYVIEKQSNGNPHAHMLIKNDSDYDIEDIVSYFQERSHTYNSHCGKNKLTQRNGQYFIDRCINIIPNFKNDSDYLNKIEKTKTSYISAAYTYTISCMESANQLSKSVKKFIKNIRSLMGYNGRSQQIATARQLFTKKLEHFKGDIQYPTRKTLQPFTLEELHLLDCDLCCTTS